MMSQTLTRTLGTRSIVFVAEAGAVWRRVSDGRCARPASQCVLAGLLFLAHEGWLEMKRPKRPYSRLHGQATAQPGECRGLGNGGAWRLDIQLPTLAGH